MNQVIKIVVVSWLILCAIFAWLYIAVVGFTFAFTDLSFMYNVTPFIGLTIVISLVKCAMYVMFKSNPIAYLEEKTLKVRSLFGKEKI